MKTKQSPPFVGMWYVVAQESCVAGEWKREYRFEPDEWIIAFFPEGRYGEIFRPEHEVIACEWRIDKATGIISVGSDPSERMTIKSIFADEGEDLCYLYFFEDLPHIPHDTDTIVRHHAHSRYKIVKAAGTD